VMTSYMSEYIFV